MVQTELMNYDEAIERLGGDEEFLVELLEELLNQLNTNLSEIKEAIENRDYRNLKLIAHSLKGASANLNVTRMAEHFLRLENLGAEGSVEGADELYHQVKIDRDELAELLNKN